MRFAVCMQLRLMYALLVIVTHSTCLGLTGHPQVFSLCASGATVQYYPGWQALPRYQGPRSFAFCSWCKLSKLISERNPFSLFPVSLGFVVKVEKPPIWNLSKEHIHTFLQPEVKVKPNVI
jgi:hypothetical protein